MQCLTDFTVAYFSVNGECVDGVTNCAAVTHCFKTDFAAIVIHEWILKQVHVDDLNGRFYTPRLFQITTSSEYDGYCR